jgi:hypothetical protein
MLAVRIADPGPWQAWLTTEDVPDPELRVVRAVDSGGEPGSRASTWARVVEDELGRPFDTGTGPLARFVMVDAGDSFDLVGTYHHLVADGLSAGFVLRDVLRRLADPASDVSPVLAPPADDLLPGRRASLGDLRAVARQLGGGSPPTRPSGSLAFVAWCLGAADTSALAARCRAEHTTVHAALCVAFARALTVLGHDGPVGIAVPADLRRILTPSPGDAVGLYATSFVMRIDAAGRRNFWDAARGARSDVNRGLRRDELLPFVRVQRLLSVVPHATMSRLLRGADTGRTLFDVSVSTIASPIPTDYGPLRLDGLYGGAHTNRSGVPLVIVSGFGGRLFLSISSTAGPHAAALRRQAMSVLRDALAASPSGRSASRLAP